MDWSVIWGAVSTVFAKWHEIKTGIEAVGAVSDDALHVIVGVALQLMFALILRRPLASWKPIVPVVGLLLFNEAVDLWVERWPSQSQQLGEGAKDFLLTLVLPVLITVSLRFRPRLGRPLRG